MSDITINIGGEIFHANFETAAAPNTVARFRHLLPYQDRIIHVRWSGEACWIPMGERDLSLAYEKATSYPAPGQIIVYPGGIPLDTVLLETNRHAMVALGALMRAVLGTSPVADGLAGTATVPARLAVQLGPGNLTTLPTVCTAAEGRVEDGHARSRVE